MVRLSTCVTKRDANTWRIEDEAKANAMPTMPKLAAASSFTMPQGQTPAQHLDLLGVVASGWQCGSLPSTIN